MATSAAPRSGGGRGRGRARMLGPATNNPGENGLPIKKYMPLDNTPETKVDSFKPVDEALDHCLGETTKDNLQSYLITTEKFAENEERIKKVVTCIFEKCCDRIDLAASGGKVAAILISSKKIGPTFRNLFLKKFQETYTNRSKQKPNEFRVFSVFLCSIFKDVRVNEGQVMKILTKPVYNILGELLDGKNMEVSQRESAMEVFRDNLIMVASLLQDSDKGQMDELFKKVRSYVIKETSPKVSCILLETFEYYCADWNVRDEMKDFYGGLMDDLTTKS